MFESYEGKRDFALSGLPFNVNAFYLCRFLQIMDDFKNQIPLFKKKIIIKRIHSIITSIS